MKLGIGSTNPVKIRAAVRGMSHFMKIDGHTGTDVDSGVGAMPIGKKTLEGAMMRAKKAIMDNDYGIGLEGGVEETEYGMFLTGWVAIIDKKGAIGLGRAESLMLPEAFARRIRQGEELGKIADEMTGIENIKKKQGAVGYFTADILSREEVFVHATIMAMARFARQEMYT